MTIATRLAELEQELGVLRAEQLAQLLGELERLRAMVWVRLTALSVNGQSQPGEKQVDELLNPKQAAHRLSMSTDYLYRHAKSLPFTVRVGRRLRFSAQGIDRYIRLHQGQ